MAATPTYSVIIPVYNSAKIVSLVIARTIAFFEKHGWSYEIILINDGSRDNSWQVIAAQAAPGARPTPGQQAPAAPRNELDVLGMTLAPVSPELRQRFQLPERQRGVVVTAVVDGSVAQERGIRPGDVIVEVAQTEVAQPGQVQDKVREQRTQGRRSVLIMVERGGEQRFVGLPVEPRG
jgi:serine protease Do